MGKWSTVIVFVFFELGLHRVDTPIFSLSRLIKYYPICTKSLFNARAGLHYFPFDYLSVLYTVMFYKISAYTPY